MMREETPWKLNVYVWDVLPKVTIDFGDVSAVTLCINAVTFSSCFRRDVGQAGEKDGYEISHKRKKPSQGSLCSGVVITDHFKLTLRYETPACYDEKREVNRILRENGLDVVIWVKNRMEERTFSKGQKKDWKEKWFHNTGGTDLFLRLCSLARAVTWWNGPECGPIALSHQCYLIFNEFNSCFRLLFMLMTLCNTIWLTVNVNSSRAALTAV